MGRNIIPRGGVQPSGGNTIGANGVPAGANIIGRNGGSISVAPGGKTHSSGKGGGGGFFGAIGNAGHWVAQKSDLAAHDIEAVPGGLYQAVKPTVDLEKGLYHTLVGNKKAAAKDYKAGDSAGKALVVGTAKQTATAVQHPLRDPFQTALTVLPVLHGLGKVGEVGGVKAFDTSNPRLLRAAGADEPVSLPHSKNPAARAYQSGYDNIMQRGLSNNPGGRVAGHALRRMAGAEGETLRRTVRMKEVDANLLDAAARKLNRGKGAGMRRLHNAALELTSNQTLPQEAQAYHLGQAEKGVNPAMNRSVAKLYGRVDQAGMLRLENGRVVVNADKFPKLAATDKALATVQKAGDQKLVQNEVMSEQGVQTRVNAPGRVRAGGEFNPETKTIEGGTAAREGRGFVSNKVTAPKAPQNASIAASRGPVVGEPRSPINSQKFTGAGIEAGQVPSKVTQSASRNFRGIARYENTLEGRKAMASKFGSDVWQSKHDVLIRVPGTKAAKLTPQMEDLIGRKELMTDTPDSLAAAEHELNHQEVLARAHTPAGTRAPKGFKWIDGRVLNQLTENTAPRSLAGKAMDELNSAVTSGTVYLKPGHTGTRVLTNLATNVIQGSWKAAARNRSLWDQLSPRDRYRALAASGQHGFQAMPHEGRVFGKVATKGANFWAKYADSAFRFNSLAYEARKAGFADTPADFTKFLDTLESRGHGMNAADWAKVEYVAKRADRAAIAYDRLSPQMRRSMARIIWFYPWVHASGAFVGHSIVEHPFKAAGLGVAGKMGEQQQENLLGKLPSYEYGLIPLSGGSNPKTTNFNTFSPTSGATALLQAIARPASVFDNLTPAMAAALALKVAPPGSNSKTPVKNAAMQLVAPTPEAQIAEAFVGRKSGIFSHSPQDAILRALLGPATPRHANRAKLGKAYGLEISGR